MTIGMTVANDLGTSRSSSSRALNDLRCRRRSFLVFVRILVKCIERADDKVLAFKVRKLVEECIQRHRDGEEEYKSLVNIVEKRLRVVVGIDYWTQARTYLHQYHRWKQTRGWSDL